MTGKDRLPRSIPERRREHILYVAKHSFLKEGYTASSMSAIAARLGGSKATLYKYFPSKEKLFEAVVTRISTIQLAAVHIPAALPDGDLRQLLTTFGRLHLRALMQPDLLMLARIIHGEGHRAPAVARIFFAMGPDRTHHVLVEKMKALGIFGPDSTFDAMLVAKQFLSMIRGDFHMRVVAGVSPPVSDDQIALYVDHAVALIAPAFDRDRAQRLGDK